MNTDTDNAPANHEEIPPLPGGGSWRWEGGKWISNDPVAEVPAEPATNAPAETSTTSEE